MTSQTFLNSRLTTVALSASLVFVMIVTARILVQKRVVDNEIAKLQSQMDKIKKDNEQLSSLMQYLKTPAYQEQQAREKLNLSKAGEFVVVLPQGNASGASNQQNQVQKPSNFKQWVNYFFNHQLN